MTSPSPASATETVPIEGLQEEPSSAGRAIVLAWVVSIAFHAVLFVAMFLMPWLADFASPPQDIPIARTELLGEMTKTTLTEAVRPSVHPAQTDSVTETLDLTPRQFESLTEAASAARPELSIIGIGTGGGEGLERYGLQAGGGPGPSFFGLGKRARGARNIVYVVDRSGSMVPTFEAVRREMRSSIEQLRRSQRFHVVFFNTGQPLENTPKKLVPATTSQKEQLLTFLDAVQPEGGTEPIPAMERAFAVRPDLIYFLTDGDFDPNLIEKLREWNKDKKVRIFTIAYVSQAGRALLEQIAREHNGEFKYVSEQEIF